MMVEAGTFGLFTKYNQENMAIRFFLSIFTNEIIPALVDVGGGSGTGSLFMDDPNWPENFNKVPMMSDWGRNELYLHRVSADGASFQQKEETFIGLPQITDLDIDASGQLFLSAWDGAGYRGNPEKGFVIRAVPSQWKYQRFVDLKKASVNELADLLQSRSAVTRLHAQQELLTRDSRKAAGAAWSVAADVNLPLESRVAATFTYAQIAGKNGIPKLVELSKDASMREFALRALADRKIWVEEVPLQPFLDGLSDASVRVQIAASIGLGRLGKMEAAEHLVKIPVPPTAVAPAKGTEGLHATPNSSIIPAHIAVRALVSLNAVEACVNALSGENPELALWALKYMHDERAVDGLITAYQTSEKQNN